MASVPLFPQAPPKTLAEVEAEARDARLVGITLLLAGGPLVGAGIFGFLARTQGADSGVFVAGVIQLAIGFGLAVVAPAALRRAWLRRLQPR